MLDSPRRRSSGQLYKDKDVSLTPGGVGSGFGLKGRKSGLKSRATQLLALRFGWVVLVIWFEVGDFFHSLSTCRFPDSILRRSHPDLTAAPTHVVLLSDPHVHHPKLSYAPGSRPWVNWLKQSTDELFMRKSWNVVMRLGRVDAVIVLGDMLDWGRGVMSDEEYEDYFNIFRSIFQLPPDVSMHFVPGNHDIPLGPNRLFSPHARERYANHFSPPNAILTISNHSLIMLDAVGLVEEDYRRYAAEMQFGEWDGVEGGVIEFVKDLGDDPPPAPRILISHIPLARPEASTCGPLRERGRILKGAGPGYQNLLGSETSKFLLEALQPSIVFSGDDHDYCEHTHPSGIREVTVKSFSSSAGIRRPGFQLLSLVAPQPNTYSASLTHADRPCFLPDQLGVYSRIYVPLGILTILFLLSTNVRAAYQRWKASGGSVYNDIKSRLSPALMNSEIIPTSTTISGRRGMGDRHVPLTLPSRKSSQHLNGLTQMTPTSGRPTMSRLMTPTAESYTPNRGGISYSVPASPLGSPRPSFNEEQRPILGPSALRRMDDDVEAGGGDISGSPTPSISRRSSYIYMNEAIHSHHSREQTYESNSSASLLSLPLPNGANGLGLSTPLGSQFSFNNQNPNSGSIRRISSTNLSTLSAGFTSTSNGNGSGSTSGHNGGSGTGAPIPIRRVTMPRMLSASSATGTGLGSSIDWPSSSTPTTTLNGGSGGGGSGGKKEKSLFNHVGHVSVSNGSGIKGFIKWLWRARNGVVGKSTKEVWDIAWPAAIVWIIVNALFFLG